ncbi:MAG: hypothetical protein M3198_01730 [Actinomycetota bacterium]|nr:hypothetical protein [Actinomycetota bacterium]
MTQPSAATMAEYRRDAHASGRHGIRRAMRVFAGWIDRGQLGAGAELVEVSRHTGSRF